MTFNGVNSSLPSSSTSNIHSSPSLSPSLSQEMQALREKVAQLKKSLDESTAIRSHYLTGFVEAQKRIREYQFHADQYQTMISSADTQIAKIQGMQKIIEDRLKIVLANMTTSVTRPAESNLATSSNPTNKTSMAKDLVNLTGDELENVPADGPSGISATAPMETTDTANPKNSTPSSSNGKRKSPPTSSSSVNTKRKKYNYYSHPIIFEAFKDRTICIKNTTYRCIMKAYDGSNYQVEDKGELVDVISGRSFYLPKIGETVLVRQGHHEPHHYYKATVTNVVDGQNLVALTVKLDGSGTEQSLTYHSLTKVLPFSEELIKRMQKKELEIPSLLDSECSTRLVGYLIPKTLATSADQPHAKPPSGSNLATSSNSKNEASTAKNPIDDSEDTLSDRSDDPMETTEMGAANSLLALKNSKNSTSSSSAKKGGKAQYTYYSHPIIFEALKDKSICVKKTSQRYIVKSYNRFKYQIEKNGQLVDVVSGRSFYLPEVGETVLIRPSHASPPNYYKATVKKVIENSNSVTLAATLDSSGTEQALVYHSLTKVLPFSEDIVNKMKKRISNVPNPLDPGLSVRIVSYLLPKTK